MLYNNVPVESVFSTLKSECIYLIKNLKIKDVEKTIDNFVKYYNNERLQEKIKELTPIQFRKLTLNNVFFNLSIFNEQVQFIVVFEYFRNVPFVIFNIFAASVFVISLL